MARLAEEKSMRSFSGTLLRDGTVYFLILVTLNVLHLLLTVLSISNDSLQAVSDVTIFTDPITSILVSRFILNLQEVYQIQNAPHLLSDFSARQSSIHFTRVIGSLGSSLPPPGDNSLRVEDDRYGVAFDEQPEGDEDTHKAPEDITVDPRA